MDHQYQERRIYQTHLSAQDEYLWMKNNQYRNIFCGFVHDQNFKLKLGIENNNSIFKIQEKLHATHSGKKYQISGDFQTWNLLGRRGGDGSSASPVQSFSKRLLEQQSLLIGTSKNLIKIEWRAGQREYKKFLYNPFISIEAQKDIQDMHLTLGLIHRSRNVNFITKLNTALYHAFDLKAKTRLQYSKNQIYFGTVSQFFQGFNCKINKFLLGYELTPKDFFYLKFQTQNLGQLIRGKQVNQQIGFYYLKKMNQNLKFALGMKSVNSTQGTLNLVFETKVPFHIKGKIDSKFNVHATVKKQINDYSTISYGIGLSNLFQKKFRLQTGLVYEFNA